MAQLDAEQMKLLGFRLRLTFEELAQGFRKLAEAQEEAVQRELEQMRLRRSRAAVAAKALDAEYQEWKQWQVANRG